MPRIVAQAGELYLASLQVGGQEKENKSQTLVGKNEYEQSHIDFAKRVLATVDAYTEVRKEPVEAEKSDMMAQDDQRTLREIRESREKTQAIMGGLN